MRWALGITYDGTPFCGWQAQPQGCGVANVVESALASVAGQTVLAVAAGRTDAGVHARLNVVHFDTSSVRPESAWVRGTNTRLPQTVAVLWAKPVSSDFHARFSALERTYRYYLFQGEHLPLWRNRVGVHRRPLSLEAMQEGARHLLGTHDFSAFRAAECQAKSPVRTLRQALVKQKGHLFVFEFSANAFLHRMVRFLVGTLVAVGEKKYPPEHVALLLREKNKHLIPPPAPPSGLYLWSILFPKAYEFLPGAGENLWLDLS